MRPLLTVVLAASVWACSAQANLPFNGDFEEADASGKAEHWQPLVIGAPAEFIRDTVVKKGGTASMRITASETTRSYIGSELMPVAAGEKIGATLWVKHANVPSGKGTVIAIAEFLDAKREQQGVAKIDVADLTKTDWQKLTGSVVIPENAAYLRLRLGFSYAQGTCWWDDVQLTFDRGISARFDLSHGRLSPSAGSLPVVILNRRGLKSQAELKADFGGRTTNLTIQLSGKPVETVALPAIVNKPGKLQLKASLYTNGALASSFNAQATVPPPLTLGPLVPTHWVVEDGKPLIRGRAQIALPGAELNRGSLKVRLTDSKETVRDEWIVKSLKDGANEFEMKLPELRPGEYIIVASVEEGGRSLATARQTLAVIPRKMASVTLNNEGFPVYDGRVVFPMGVFNGGARMKEMSPPAFTVSHSYNTVEARLFGELDDARAKAFLDETERAGLKALMLVPRHALFAQDWETVRRRIQMFRNHPGLLAWDEEEGIARGDMKPQVLAELARVIRELDPHHPIMVGDSRDVIGRIPADRANFFLADAMDMGMWWWYPFPVSATANALEGDEAGSAVDMPLPAFLVNAATKKPLWVGIQAYEKPPASARYPTREEYRWQAYAAICAGAKGLMWYGGSVTGGAYLKPEEANWDYIKTLAGELGQLAPVLTGKTLAAPGISPAAAPISAIIKQRNGRTILFAVNRSMKPVEATIAVPNWKLVSRASDKQPVAIANQSIKEKFEPLGVRVYELAE